MSQDLMVGTPREKFLLCSLVVLHWEQPMRSLCCPCWSVLPVKGQTWSCAGRNLSCWKHEEGRKGERACRAPKAGSRGGIQAVLEMLQQREHHTLGPSEGVKEAPPSWIQT